ncbi:methyltransferase domain-containing protein [Actinopolymorpha sp. B11F2]|uniref:methyltransferase domain-containing protein n=1 Tax=Actinopolymorpha sp. B11F2 TaxID=3160862 RepID=UPI0032E3881E
MDMANLQCPETGLPLRRLRRADAEQITGQLLARRGALYEKADDLLVRIDNKAAYPVIKGVPLLLVPEAQTPLRRDVDLSDPRWGEAYEEMDFYSRSATAHLEAIDGHIAALESLRNITWPSLRHVDAAYDAASQWDAYSHLGALSGQVMMQLGGSGFAAMKTLIAGGGESWLVTPMLSEALYARELSRRLGVPDRFHAVVAVAEQLPFVAGRFDAIYSGGCLHHMATEFAGPEISRVLAVGGRFAAVEPWQTPLHKLGTKVLGKREPNAYCRPLTMERLAPMRGSFGSFEVRNHGPLLRYAALAWLKLSKWEIKPETGMRMTWLDDRLPLPRRLGGSVAVLATKGAEAVSSSLSACEVLEREARSR